MDPVPGTVKVTERLRLLAWEDSFLERPVFVSLVVPGEVESLADLASRIHLGDLVDAVRKSHEKLPAGNGDGEVRREAQKSIAAVDEDSFEIPSALRNMRFVFPSSFYVTVTKELFTKGGFGVLKGDMLGTGEGGPLSKLGLLGRAQVEEKTGDTGHPFFLATLLQSLRVLADEIYRRMAVPSKIRDSFADLSAELRSWTTRLLPGVQRRRAIERLLANPLAPFAMRRSSPPPAIGDLAQQVLEAGNPYGLTVELAHELDEHFEGKLGMVLDRPEAEERMRDRITEAVEAWDSRLMFDEIEERTRRKLLLVIAALFVVGFVAGLSPWLLNPPQWAEIVKKLADADMAAYLLFGAVTGVSAASLAGLAGTARIFWRRIFSPVCKRWRRTSRALKRRREVVRALPGAKWRTGMPKLIESYRKFKEDCLDYHTLSRLPLPPLDNSEMYAEMELRDKWGQNAAVCYDDVYPSLIIGTANRAAVYFIDVAGSTELSAQQTLSNALEIYGRMLKVANEKGMEPLWRKEIGDGRIYCHPAVDAFKRAILSAQGAAHAKVGLGIGVGLSVGEIYRDVTTGDFLNEVTNRASRLNSRDDAIAEYVRIRYAKHPHRVHVKWGRMHNTGIALDDRAIHELGGSSVDADPPGVPFLWKFPVPGDASGHAPGSVSFFVERLRPGAAEEFIATVGNTGVFDRWVESDKAVGFEVFCHKSEPNLHYPTPLEGSTPEEYLSLHAIENVAFTARVGEHEVPVTRVPVTLPTGETVNLALKSEMAHLKGLAPTIIGEVEVPAMMLRDDTIRLAEFLSGL